jgi:hypothetical protein
MKSAQAFADVFDLIVKDPGKDCHPMGPQNPVKFGEHGHDEISRQIAQEQIGAARSNRVHRAAESPHVSLAVALNICASNM